MKQVLILFFMVMVSFLLLAKTVQKVQSEDNTQYVISLSRDRFSPNVLSAHTGDIVIFENKDTIPHWPASNIHPTHQIYPEFDPKQGVAAGASWRFQFNRAGIWNYHDHLAPNIAGTIT